MNNNVVKPLIAFVLACAVGLVITFFGLWFYYDEARLGKELTRSYTAKDFQTLAGQAKSDNETLLVNDVQPDGLSFVNAGFLHIDTRFYESLTINFSDKHANQPLLLAVKLEGKEQPVERPVLYSNEMSSRFIISDLVKGDEIITDVGLLTDRFIAPYRIRSLVFSPKKLDYKTFAYLLMDCFAINKQWENWSINTHKSPYQVLIPPKILVLIYFTVVGLLFLVYLRLTKRPLINAWWATLVAAWFALDAHYLVEKTVITKNTYDTFAHLSDDEKDLVLSPEAAKIAQTIKSVLPDDGKHKKIRVRFFGPRTLEYDLSRNSYLIGKIYYILQPNLVYGFSKVIPLDVWKKGDFYYAEIWSKEEHAEYSIGRSTLTISSGLEVSAKKMLNSHDMSVYYIVGIQGETGK